MSATEFDQLLACDEANVPIARRVLDDFTPELLETLNEAATIFRTFTKAYSEGQERLARSGAYAEEIAAISKARPPAGYATESVKEIMSTATHPARKAWAALHGRRIRPLLAILTFRSYMWALTDLLRLRLTACAGAKRVEVEGVALLNLVRHDPVVGWEWLTILTDDQGQAFHTRHRREIDGLLRRFDLAKAYSSGSGVALHPRFAGVVRGLSLDFEAGVQRVELNFQEFQPDRPVGLIVEAWSLLAMQVGVFRAMAEGLPEADDKLLHDGRLPVLHEKVGRLRGLLRERFPEDVARWEA